MDRNSIERTVAIIFVEQLGLTTEAAARDRTVKLEDIGADSLDRIEIVMALEEEFEIEISDEEAEKCDSLADFVSLVAQKKGLT